MSVDNMDVIARKRKPVTGERWWDHPLPTPYEDAEPYNALRDLRAELADAEQQLRGAVEALRDLRDAVVKHGVLPEGVRDQREVMEAMVAADAIVGGSRDA